MPIFKKRRNKMRQVIILSLIAFLLLFANCASQSYADRLDVYGIGAGPKPGSNDAHAIDESKLNNAKVAYTPQLVIKEQDVSKNTKAALGDALTREFEGKPELLAAWLSEKQDLENVALLIDKNGVVAWHGRFNKQDVPGVIGVEGYKMLGGAQRITFSEALKKYVDKEKTQKYKEDKKIEFKKGFFDYGKEGPFVYTKLPQLKVKGSDGTTVDISEVAQNGKPTLLIFFMSSARKKEAADKAQNAIGFITSGGGTQKIVPQKVLYFIEDGYLFEK